MTSTPKTAVAETPKGMLAEAINVIQATAVAAARPQKLEIGNPHQSAYLVDGELKQFEHERPARQHTVYDLQSLKPWCEETTPIWHDDDRVVVILDDDGHRDDTVEMPLPLHPTFEALCEAPRNVDQAAMIRWLRLNLKDILDKDHPNLISLLREIRITQNVAGTGTVTHGRESMGKTIDNAVTGVDAVPEDVLLRVPLWLHHDAFVSVPCYFDIDTSNVKFTLAPKPGAIEQAKADGQAWLHEQLEELAPESSVFFGTPNREDCDD